jgi:hypothetical protein
MRLRRRQFHFHAACSLRRLDNNAIEPLSSQGTPPSPGRIPLTQADRQQIDTTNLNVPSQLSTSRYLRDLSSVAARDYTGGDTTAATLGLAQTYTIALLGACSSDASASTTCTGPQLGFTFNPASDLRLDGTSVQGTFGSGFSAAFTTYAQTTTFLAAAYIFSLICIVLAPLLTLFVHRLPILGTASVALSSLATLFLLAASIASVIVITRLNGAFNAAFSDAGLVSSVGSGLFVLSFLASLFALLMTILLHSRARGASTAIKTAFPRDVKDGAYESYSLNAYPASRKGDQSLGAAPQSYAARGLSPSPERTGLGEKGAAQKMGGIMSRMPQIVGGRHRYVQIEEPGVNGARADSFRAAVEGGHGERVQPEAYEPYAGRGM